MRVVCDELSVVFPSKSGATVALDGLNFSTRHGEFVAIAGKSGCGKTTLLRTIAGLCRPTRGSVRLEAADDDPNDDALLVFQQDGLFPWMRVLENAAFGLEMKGVPRAEREERAAELLRTLGLQGREHAWPDELSLGMRQRVALVRAFLRRPALMLMDEPFAALDAQTRIVLQEELLALWQPTGMSVLFVTHDIDEAIMLSDRVLMMGSPGGRIEAEIHVPLKQPRHADDLTSPEFVQIKRQVYRLLGLGGKLDPVRA